MTYAITAVVLFLVIGLAIRLLEPKLLYHPSPLEAGAIDSLKQAVGDGGDRYEEVDFVAEDGVRVTGWLGTPKEPRGTLLWFHGNAGSVAHRWGDFTAFVRDLGLRTLIVDYRGYGRSEGSPGEAGLYLDARAALDFLGKRGVDSKDVWVLGRSLGGAVAVELATARPVKGLVLESTFTSAPAMGRAMLPFFPVSWFIRSRFDSETRIATLDLPILLFHGRDDRIVPFSHAENLAAAAKAGNLTLVPVESDHNDLSMRLGKAYFDRVGDFLAK
ncbi:MAG: alpha/beta hydrolase [Planctomycetota bacterium]